jgi:hypothetical protein
MARGKVVHGVLKKKDITTCLLEEAFVCGRTTSF